MPLGTASRVLAGFVLLFACATDSPQAQSSTLATVLAESRDALGLTKHGPVNTLLYEVDSTHIRDRGRGGSSRIKIDVQIGVPDRLVTVAYLDGGVITRTGVKSGTLYQRNTGPGHKFFSLLAGEELAAMHRHRAARTTRHAARLLAAMLLSDVFPIPVALTYVGTARAPDGQEADVIDGASSGEPLFRLFVNKRTRLPTRLDFTELETPLVRGQNPTPPSAYEKVAQSLYLSDHRSVAGLQLPHAIVHTMEGRTFEEWRVKTVRINGPLPD